MFLAKPSDGGMAKRKAAQTDVDTAGAHAGHYVTSHKAMPVCPEPANVSPTVQTVDSWTPSGRIVRGRTAVSGGMRGPSL